NKIKKKKHTIKSTDEQEKQKFQHELHKCLFESKEAYETAKLTKDKYEERKEKLAQYQKKKATLEQQIKELKANLKTKERIDLAVMEEDLQKSREAYETALKKWEQIKSVLQNLLQLISDMKETATNTAA